MRTLVILDLVAGGVAILAPAQGAGLIINGLRAAKFDVEFGQRFGFV
jgi:hypothetical protein